MNHHAQRLLVAASRGARIQRLESHSACWVPMNVIYGYRDCESERIHPDDIACQYGPIATQLRLMAASTKHEWDETSIRYMADQVVYDIMHDVPWDEPHYLVRSTRSERQWLLLFAAELAADAGM